MTTEQPPILTVLDKILQSPCYNCNEKLICKKRIVNTGYFYFDYLKEKFNYKEIHQEVLIAPSWNYSQNNFLNENFIDLINVLLKKGEKVIFRPHPEHLKRSRKISFNCC